MPKRRWRRALPRRSPWRPQRQRRRPPGRRHRRRESGQAEPPHGRWPHPRRRRKDQGQHLSRSLTSTQRLGCSRTLQSIRTPSAWCRARTRKLFSSSSTRLRRPPLSHMIFSGVLTLTRALTTRLPCCSWLSRSPATRMWCSCRCWVWIARSKCDVSSRSVASRLLALRPTKSTCTSSRSQGSALTRGPCLTCSLGAKPRWVRMRALSKVGELA
mmetsp:Transcript_40500/g.101734  ORF Transcript_40500/g.101734 Transcript_40500/m.101734 type:complete len:214 (-) Transcript_40500:495-1136(-)